MSKKKKKKSEDITEEVIESGGGTPETEAERREAERRKAERREVTGGPGNIPHAPVEDIVSGEGLSSDEVSAPTLEEFDKIASALEAKTAEAEEAEKKYLLARADLENYRKRSEKENTEAKVYAAEKMIKEILPVVDNLERALAHAEEVDGAEGLKSLEDGVRITLDQLHTVLERSGLNKIEALGTQFDPNLHEAISHEEDEEADDGTVIKEFQKGYKLKERLLRPSVVSVSKKP